MARRRKGIAVHGWVVLDKPPGMTSTQAVGAVRRIFDARKAGHAGTLDPLATGVLPIALGEATKTVPYAVEGRKHYRFTVRWGAATDTDDAEGTVIATSDSRPNRTAIEAQLGKFTGTIAQIPPVFSAIKIGGDRAYDLARAGEAVSLQPRPVIVFSLKLAEIIGTDTATFEAECGKGTYVRALARDMGAALGCLGHLTALRRTHVAGFSEADAVSLDALKEAAARAEGPPFSCLLPVEAALCELPALNVGQSDAARLLRGQPVLLRGRDSPATAGGHTYATCKGNLIAVGRIERGEMHPVRVFRLED
jgi:tRNA pseudouridine55 synthase